MEVIECVRIAYIGKEIIVICLMMCCLMSIVSFGGMMMSDVAKTPREELECKKKYLYEYSMFWECNDGSKCQILEEDVCDKLNEQQATINRLDQENADILGARIKAQEEWEKCTDKLKEKIGEQQATIEHLTKSRDKWSQSAKLHSEYFNCLEKAIERAYEEKPYPKIDDIMNIYSKLEKGVDDE